MLERWRRDARQQAAQHGRLAVGWRWATIIALAVVAACCLVWLRDYLTAGMLPMLPVLGAASAVTFIVATGALPLAAVLWMAGLARSARVAGVIALASWVLTVVVFQILLSGLFPAGGGGLIGVAELLAWTLLFGLATLGLWQRPPTARLPAAGAFLVVAATALAFASTGAQRAGVDGYRLVAGPSWLPPLLDQGSDTLHTSVLVGLALLLVVGAALWRLDPRPALAGLWLLPFALLPALGGLGPVGLAVAATAVVTVPTLGAAGSRSAA